MTVMSEVPILRVAAVDGEKRVSLPIVAAARTCSCPFVALRAWTLAAGASDDVNVRIDPGGVASGTVAQLQVQS